jgi:peptidoglycan/LPS O-acetylase OafA/YrhL
MHHRQTHIDALKLIAAQLIVLHHFAAYGPLSDALEEVAPRLSDWLFEYARMAVQAFLVIAGFLAAKSLAPAGRLRVPSPWRAIAQRYLRLVPPFVAALLLAMACSALARQWLTAHFIPAAPTWGQFFAHSALLHSLLGVDSLSAGVWYVAIDFQLFVVMTALLWLGRGWARAWVLGLMLAALFFFNRHEDFDNWALYFFAAYGMGAAAFWASKAQRAGAQLALLALLACAGGAALAVDFRERIAVALGVALLLGLAQWRAQNRPTTPSAGPSWLARWVAVRGNSSYALFLVHFSVLMLCNALWVQQGLQGAGALAWVVLGYWVASLGVALLFERWVERPLSGWFSISKPLLKT